MLALIKIKIKGNLLLTKIHCFDIMKAKIIKEIKGGAFLCRQLK